MTANTNTITVTFPKHLLPVLEEKVKVINRKAKRNGFTPVEVSYGASSTIFKGARYKNSEGFPVRQIRTSGSVTLTAETYESYKGEKWIIEAIEVTCTTETFGFDGHRLVGVTENVDGIFTLNNFEEDKFDLSEHRGTCHCDHCGHDRKRNKVFFVANDANKLIRLGSSCVSLYFEKATNVLNYFSFDEDLNNLFDSFNDENLWDEEYGGRSIPRVHTVESIISYTHWKVETEGYISVSRANETETLSTKDRVLTAIHSNKAEDKPEEGYFAKVEAKVVEIIEWAKAKKDDNDYFGTVFQILEAGCVTDRLTGYVVGILGWHLAETAKKVEADTVESKWIDSVGDRKVFTGEIKRINAFEGHYGTTYFHTIVTKEGNVISHKRNGSSLAEEGETVEFTATIKEHSEFRGVKQTVVQRPAKVKVVA